MRRENNGPETLFNWLVQELDNLTDEEKRLPIPERMARALKHAGVSITVTSVTDIAAFAIGATTVSRVISLD